ncbi:Zinc finger GRF-type protein [Arachis hypogaea]|nr:Zinc finger GRF-type protein [Arachis hypogaea]
MLKSTSQGSGSCSRSRSHGSVARNPNRARTGKVPHWCNCGMRPVLRWSGTEANSEKPFFRCPNYNTFGKRWCEHFCGQMVRKKKALVEEMKMKIVLSIGR